MAESTPAKRRKKEFMDPLDREQINYALEQIKELHPLDRTPLYVVYPGLRPFRTALSFIPGMSYEELGDEEHEMNDLLDSNA